MVIIFLCQDIFIHVDDSVPVSLWCLHRTLACCFVSDAHSPTEFSKNNFFFVDFFYYYYYTLWAQKTVSQIEFTVTFGV